MIQQETLRYRETIDIYKYGTIKRRTPHLDENDWEKRTTMTTGMTFDYTSIGKVSVTTTGDPRPKTTILVRNEKGK